LVFSDFGPEIPWPGPVFPSFDPTSPCLRFGTGPHQTPRFRNYVFRLEAAPLYLSSSYLFLLNLDYPSKPPPFAPLCFLQRSMRGGVARPGNFCPSSPVLVLTSVKRVPGRRAFLPNRLFFFRNLGHLCTSAPLLLPSSWSSSGPDFPFLRPLDLCHTTNRVDETDALGVLVSWLWQRPTLSPSPQKAFS